MSERKAVILFIFSRVSKKPKTIEDMKGNAWASFQKRKAHHWAEVNGCTIAQMFVDWTTYARAKFTKSAALREAVVLAEEMKCDIVMADVRESLRRTAADRIVDCAQDLDHVPIDIWDATQNATWQSLTLTQRQRIIEDAVVVRVSTSKAIRAGMRSKENKVKPPPANGRLGSRANKNKADAFSLRHLDFVRLEMTKLLPGAVLSPSALAKALDQSSFKPRRTRHWSHNAAKNLLDRLKSLEVTVNLGPT